MEYYESIDRARSEFSMELLSYTVNGNSIELKFSKGLLRLKVIAGNIIRITFKSKNTFLGIPSFE
jgi:hypothetical protein